MNKNANSADVIRLTKNKAKAQEQQRSLLKSLYVSTHQLFPKVKMLTNSDFVHFFEGEI